MTTKVVGVVVVALQLVVPSWVLAQDGPGEIPVEVIDLIFRPDFGSGRTAADDTTWDVRFRRLRGNGTLACRGVSACEAAGLDGAGLQIQQDMRIIIDIIGAGVVGRARGQIVIDRGSGYWPIHLGFRAAIVGDSQFCDGTSATNLQINEQGPVTRWTDHNESDPGVVGSISLDLMGTLTCMGRGGATNGTDPLPVRMDILFGSGVLSFGLP